ncbi:MAG: MFS transporter [Pseudomonadales bacterium]
MLAAINRNLIVLFVCQMIFTTGTILLVTIGGIAGYGLAPDPAWATLPVALMVVGTACTAIPAAMLMKRVGRRLGFMCGAALGASGALLVVAALTVSSFPAFCLAGALIGASISFSQQFRFAGAESVPMQWTSFAVSFIMFGSIFGAIMGPELVSYSASASQDKPFTLAFKVVIALYVFALLLLSLLRNTAIISNDEVTETPRSILQLLGQPIFFVAVLAGVVGQGVMTYIMTATPISMNVGNNFSIQQTSDVIQAHVIAMHLPSLITPIVIARLGLLNVLALGLIAISSTVVIGLGGHELLHYWTALVVLGLGWNFLFIGGTTLLVQAYRDSERFKAQAFNDFSVFTMSALASLFSGTVLYTFGWNSLLVSAVPALVLMAVAIVVLKAQQAKAPA